MLDVGLCIVAILALVYAYAIVESAILDRRDNRLTRRERHSNLHQVVTNQTDRKRN